jgi:hypothetical protein
MSPIRPARMNSAPTDSMYALIVHWMLRAPTSNPFAIVGSARFSAKKSVLTQNSASEIAISTPADR